MIRWAGEASPEQPPQAPDEDLDRWRVLRPHVGDGVPLARAARQAGVPLRTAQRWLARYRAAGRAGLARTGRADARVRKRPPPLLDRDPRDLPVHVRDARLRLGQGQALDQQEHQVGAGDGPAQRDRPAPLPRGPPVTIARTAAAIAFVDTREHHRFTEFADTVRAAGYIGLCHGRPGVGKTLSARRYAGWDDLEPYLEGYRFKDYEPTPHSATQSRTLVYTPKVHITPKSLDKDLTFWHERLSWAVETALHPGRPVSDLDSRRGRFAELVIVDEADRLSTSALEQLRDHHDRTGIGVILIGMPGIEKRLSRYPQLYSRVGFVH